ncbi:MAG: acyl-CoA thioesterase [Rhizobiales bacterium]|jgi:acyl-CoA thioester hydrolase|nr:acyl-CoA thioesterase [Hyphomicrobiales bacterium]
MARPTRSTRADYRHMTPITTRWCDNDVFAHVNNVVYYQWFDTAVTGYLLATNALDPLHSPVITLVVETRCSYFESTSFPDIIEVGIAIQKLGTSSMTYQIGIFKQGQDVAIAQGYLIHVAVERATQTPTPIPAHMRAVLEAIQI